MKAGINGGRTDKYDQTVIQYYQSGVSPLTLFPPTWACTDVLDISIDTMAESEQSNQVGSLLPSFKDQARSKATNSNQDSAAAVSSSSDSEDWKVPLDFKDQARPVAPAQVHLARSSSDAETGDAAVSASTVSVVFADARIVESSGGRHGGGLPVQVVHADN